MKRQNSYKKSFAPIAIIAVCMVMLFVTIPSAVMADEMSDSELQMLSQDTRGVSADEPASTETITDPALTLPPTVDADADKDAPKAADKIAQEEAVSEGAAPQSTDKDTGDVSLKGNNNADLKVKSVKTLKSVKPSSAADVATVEELMQAVNDSNASVINLTSAEYRLKPQASSSSSYADEGYLTPNRDITFTSDKGAKIINAKGKRHIYINAAENAVLTFDKVTLAGEGGGGILHRTPNDGTLTLTGADIKNCRSNDIDRNSLNGGAVEVFGDVVLNNCTFSGNTSEEVDSPYMSGGKTGADGGAVYATGSISAKNCKVNGNSSIADEYNGKSGGAFYAGTSININGGEYTSNFANNGGAVFVRAQGSVIEIKDAVFSGNKAVYNGGAVLNCVELNAKNTKFIGNEAGYFGGAIEALSGSETNIDNCVFENNKLVGADGIAYSGGAVEFDSDFNSANINNSKFKGNSGHDGGAVSAYGPGTLSVNGCEFTGNTAENYGGAINLMSRANVEVSGCTFDNNKADTYGGAIYANYYSTLNVENSAIKNSSLTGGAGYGGGLFTCGTVTMLGSSLEGNSADNNGGAWYIHYGSASADGLTVKGNSAMNGGGIFCGYSKLDLNNSTLEGNNAVAGGGAMFVYYDSAYTLGVTLNNTVVKANAADRTAGIYTYNRELIKTNNTTFANNTSSGGYSWEIPAALIDDPANPDALQHTANIVNTTYTSPYTNAYNNIDINYPAQGDIFLHYVRNYDASDDVSVDSHVSPYNAIVLKDQGDADVTSWKPEGKSFDGWAYDREGTSRVGTLVVYKANVTVYAQWKDANSNEPAVTPPPAEPPVPEITVPSTPANPDPSVPGAVIPEVQIDEPAINPSIPDYAQHVDIKNTPAAAGSTLIAEGPVSAVPAVQANPQPQPASAATEQPSAPAPATQAEQAVQGTLAQPAEQAAPQVQESSFGNQMIPFGVPSKGGWSLINLALTIIAALMMTWMVISARRKEDEYANEYAGAETARRKANRLSLFSIIAAATIAILFVLLEDMTQTMAYIDKWTPLFLAIFFIQSALLIVAHAKPGKNNNEGIA